MKMIPFALTNESSRNARFLQNGWMLAEKRFHSGQPAWARNVPTKDGDDVAKATPALGAARYHPITAIIEKSRTYLATSIASALIH
jgi:hypothetical protein